MTSDTELRDAVADIVSRMERESTYGGATVAMGIVASWRETLRLALAAPPSGAPVEGLRAALEHRREYEAKGWSHAECGAEEDIRERLLLAATPAEPPVESVLDVAAAERAMEEAIRTLQRRWSLSFNAVSAADLLVAFLAARGFRLAAVPEGEPK